MKSMRIKYWPHLLLVCTSLLYGLSVVSNFKLAGLLAVAALYKLDLQFTRYQLRRYYMLSSLGMLTIFLSCTWWFLKITATGWNTYIWILPPAVWLGVVLTVCVGLSSLFATLPRLIFFYYVKRQGSEFGRVFVWAMAMVLGELSLSLAMSFITRGSGVPLLPSWNFSAAALLAPTQGLVGSVLPYLGFWGTSYLVFLIGALSVEVYRKRSIKKVLVSTLALVLGFLLIAGCAKLFDSSALKKTNGEEGTVDVVAISAKDGTNQYFDSILKHPFSDTAQTMVVLPEYSSLLRPFPGGGLNNPSNNDYRKDYTTALKKREVYTLGTEDAFYNGKRYVESYVVNSELEKTKVEQKTLLVPGGEYMIPWTGKLIKTLDSRSIDTFYKERGRFVDTSLSKLDGDAEDTSLGSKIGVGACSMVLIPFSYRDQVAEGAEILASNVSFAQFQNAPEYARYSLRFSAFIARSLDRPFISSSSFGPAYIMDSHGSILKETHSGTISGQARLSKTKTPYGVLGDAGILLILAVISATIAIGTVVVSKRTTIKPRKSTK